MAVYVDDAFVAGDWGFFTGGGHLQADSLAELQAFAAEPGPPGGRPPAPPPPAAPAPLRGPRRPPHPPHPPPGGGGEGAPPRAPTAEPWREATRRRRALRAA